MMSLRHFKRYNLLTMLYEISCCILYWDQSIRVSCDIHTEKASVLEKKQITGTKMDGGKGAYIRQYTAAFSGEFNFITW